MLRAVADERAGGQEREQPAAVAVDDDDPRLRPAFEALAAFVRAGRLKKLDVERANGEPVVGSPLEPLLVDLGFRLGPKKLTLTA